MEYVCGVKLRFHKKPKFSKKELSVLAAFCEETPLFRAILYTEVFVLNCLQDQFMLLYEDEKGVVIRNVQRFVNFGHFFFYNRFRNTKFFADLFKGKTFRR